MLRLAHYAMIVQEGDHRSDKFIVVPHQHMTAGVVANESAVWDVAREKLCVSVPLVQIVFGADRERRDNHWLKGLRKFFDSQLPFERQSHLPLADR